MKLYRETDKLTGIYLDNGEIGFNQALELFEITEEEVENELKDIFPEGIAKESYIVVAEVILSKLKGE